MKCRNCGKTIEQKGAGRVMCSKKCSIDSMGRDNPFKENSRHQSYRMLARHAAKTDPGSSLPNF